MLGLKTSTCGSPLPRSRAGRRGHQADQGLPPTYRAGPWCGRRPSTISSQDTYAFTFDSTTVPTGLVVSRLIADGVAWVQSRVYPMAAGSTDAAAVCVALYAAAMIERTWPDDDQSLQRALDLERRLDQMLGDLVRANAAANTGTITGQPPAPQYKFPFPDDNYLDYPSYV